MTAAVETPQTSVASRYAGFWIRVVAFFIDAVVIGAVLSLITIGQAGLVTYDHWLQFQPWRNAIETLASFAYFTFLWSALAGGQTIGMRLLRLRVVGTDGRPISYTSAVVRWVGIVISAAALLLGLLWVGIDRRKQGWHDKIAGTFVVHADEHQEGA